MSAQADLPLTLEEVIAKKEEVTVEIGFDYGNLYTSDFMEEANQDTLSMSLGTRYGLTDSTEIYGKVRGVAYQARSAVKHGGDRDSMNGARWTRLSIGINHQFSPDNEPPALLGYLQTNVLENPSPTKNNRAVSSKTWVVGMVTYRRIDPVVLSLSSGFQYNPGRDTGDPTVDAQDNEDEGTEAPTAVTPGNIIFVSPKLNLALNAETSVSWGVRWSHKVGKRVGGETIGMNATQTSLLLGAAYAVSKRATMHFDVSADISGRGGGNAGALLRYTF